MDVHKHYFKLLALDKFEDLRTRIGGTFKNLSIDYDYDSGERVWIFTARMLWYEDEDSNAWRDGTDASVHGECISGKSG